MDRRTASPCSQASQLAPRGFDAKYDTGEAYRPKTLSMLAEISASRSGPPPPTSAAAHPV